MPRSVQGAERMDEHAAIEFSTFTHDLRAGQLRCAATPLPLRPKTRGFHFVASHDR